MGLCTPCAGHRPGAADSNSAAELCSRHRAKNESDKVSKSGELGRFREECGIWLGMFSERFGGFEQMLNGF